jgi:hypothetical protein
LRGQLFEAGQALVVQGGTAISMANLADFEVIVVNGPTLLSIPI